MARLLLWSLLFPSGSWPVLTRAQESHRDGAPVHATAEQLFGDYTLADTCPNPGDLAAGRSSRECPLPGRLGIIPSLPSTTIPWSDPPHCISVPAPSENGDAKNSSEAAEPRLDCLFSLRPFRNGHGISIITSTTTMADLVGRDAFGDRPAPVAARAREETLGRAYEIVDFSSGQKLASGRGSGERGKGVVASRKIRRGEILMVDVPALLVGMPFLTQMKPHLRRRVLNKALDRLPDETRRKVEGLQRGHGKGVDGILGTNTQTVMLGGDQQEGGEVHVGLFAEVARINHSCRPNAYYRFSQSRLTIEVVSYRAIEPGEEIVISYVPVTMKRGPRREYLSQNWGFDCACALCRAGPDEAAESENRRAHMDELRGTMEDAKGNRYFSDAIAIARDLRDFGEWEGLPLLEHEFHDLLAELHSLDKNYGEAAKFARMAVDGWRRFGSVDTKEIQKASEFLARVTRLWWDRLEVTT